MQGPERQRRQREEREAGEKLIDEEQEAREGEGERRAPEASELQL